MKIALVSLHQVWQQKDSNMELCRKYIRLASEKVADLVIFPEMTLTGFTMDIGLAEDPYKSESAAFFQHESSVQKIAVAYGLSVKSGDKATNDLVFLNKNGDKLTSYSKIHPFSYSGEDNYYSPGNKIESVEIADANIGLTICYDLRFPELFQALSKKCNIIITIANWPEKRVKHWETLLEARAIENQCYMVGVNRIGTDGNNLRYSRSSAIVDPEGCRLTPYYTSDDMDIYEVQLEKAEIYRKSFPVKKDRRRDLYISII